MLAGGIRRQQLAARNIEGGVVRSLQAPLVLEYPFTRSTGPVIGAFLTGLREGVICGIRRADGTVLCPPSEYDPLTSEPLTEMVEVGQSGEVVSWAWNGEPRPMQPFDRPFAWALIRLDGADTSMLHAVYAPSAAEMSTGMRVRVVWRTEREGHIADIAGFERSPPGRPRDGRIRRGRPAGGAGCAGRAGDAAHRSRRRRTGGERVHADPDDLHVHTGPGAVEIPAAMADKRILGERCGATGQVFVPPRGVSPLAGAATSEVVELPDTGYVDSFNITRVPIERRPDLKPPYCSAWIVLDARRWASWDSSSTSRRRRSASACGCRPVEARRGTRDLGGQHPGLGAHRRARRGS